MPLYWSVAWCTEATRGSSPLFTLCGCSLLSAVSTTAFICAHAYTATDAATRPATTRRSTARITSKEGTSSSSAPGTTAQRGRHSPPGQVRVPAHSHLPHGSNPMPMPRRAGHLQLGGGITDANAREWLDAGASKVIVTSFLFPDARFSLARLQRLAALVGKDRLVVDVRCVLQRCDVECNKVLRPARGSCRRRGDKWFVAMDRWQTVTDMEVNQGVWACCLERSLRCSSTRPCP